MLIRVSGYNNGGKEYLEEGQKSGREYTREELDERVILYGDLDLTQKIYQQIPDKGQERYATFTLSFREDELSYDMLLSITQEFKQFLMYAYEDEEYNFYAEAHLPKIKFVADRKTGEPVERKPHIHIFIPRKNLLSGKEMNPRGMVESQVAYFEAFQEYINQKYHLASPREHVRVDPTSAADVLSRYKGDDFRGRHQAFKKQLVRDVIDKGIFSREDFYAHVASFGDTRVRHQGKENEYLAVRLPGDEKFTNLKETIFQDDFIVRREVKKPPLDKAIIRDRLRAWPQRAKEIKYVSKATPSFRQRYKAASPEEKLHLLAQRQAAFYDKYRGNYDVYPAERQSDNQRSVAETGEKRITRVTDGVQGVPSGDVATHRAGGEAFNTVFLPGDAHLHLGQSASGGSAGLRSDLSAGRGRRRNAGEYHAGKFTAIPGVPTVSASIHRAGYRFRHGMGGGDAFALNMPPYARHPHQVTTLAQIQRRGTVLFGERDRPLRSTAVIPVRRVMPKPNKKASFVAAYFLRRYEENQLHPAQRQDIRAIDTQFYAARRAIQCDERLTQNEKSQYVSILTFERLKAHHAIKQPTVPYEKEMPNMGSADIRKLIKTPRIPDNSISGVPPEDNVIPPAERALPD